jgi:beta-phosphoglucomutase
MQSAALTFPELGTFTEGDGLLPLLATANGAFVAGMHGVRAIAATRDGKVQFVGFDTHTLALVGSALGYPAYYPVLPVVPRRPVRAVLMDLDGTSVRSEGFWIWIIERTTASLLGRPGFALEPADLPFVSGHSVSEHLEYCIRKYCPDRLLEDARRLYFEHTHREMREILEGRGRSDAFVPAPGLRELLLDLKGRGLKIALVTSGLYEKAYPEILAAFRAMNLGDPRGFYDTIITAGFPLRPGEIGTLGELSPKPHPWLYAEAFRVGLGLSFDEREAVMGIEDSGAGICAVRLAGLQTVGIAGGNVEESGALPLCHRFCGSLEEVASLL